jgi:hypothetical protein
MTSADTATREQRRTTPRERRKPARAAADGQVAARNSQFDWDAFDPRAYRAHNYRTLRDDDREIVTRLREFFGGTRLPAQARGLDIGPGANLYPSLAMLPLCSGVDLIEYSTANVEWLRGQQRPFRGFFDHAWDPFWQLYGEHDTYREHVRRRGPLAEFRRKATVSQGSIFSLKRPRWDIGTMFFVACSISADKQEFFRAVGCFLRALKPRAPFAAAFMTGSPGYEINGTQFPAVPVDEDMVRRSLRELAPNANVVPIDSDLRPGVGMVLATGYRGK